MVNFVVTDSLGATANKLLEIVIAPNPNTRQLLWNFSGARLLRLGIVGRERMHYWKLLLWTAVRRRELLPLAVTLAIHGFHFRKTVQQHIH